jgi:hypothetical protein
MSPSGLVMCDKALLCDLFLSYTAAPKRLLERAVKRQEMEAATQRSQLVARQKPGADTGPIRPAGVGW